MGDYYLGCDVSLRSGGYAIIRVKNRRVEVVKQTTIKTDNKMTDGQALRHILKELQNFAEGYVFKSIVREKGFTRFNLSTQQIFKALGIVHLLLEDKEPMIEISPTTIKKVIGGHGKAEKLDVISGVVKITGLPMSLFEIPPKSTRGKMKYKDDEADAVAAVLTHLIQEGKIDV